MTELEFRTAVAMYFNETYREDEFLNVAKVRQCNKCGHYDLEEEMKQDSELSDKPYYCEKCWNNREFV